MCILQWLFIAISFVTTLPSILDTITNFFPDAVEDHVSGMSEEAVKVHASGKIIHTFAPNDTTDYVHHLVIRPNGKYILKLDSGDGGHSKDDFVFARGRTPLMSGDTFSAQGITTFHIVNNTPDSNDCTFLCFERSNRRKQNATIIPLNHELSPAYFLRLFLSSNMVMMEFLFLSLRNMTTL